MKRLFLPIRLFKEICSFQKIGTYACPHCIETSHLEELEKFWTPQIRVQSLYRKAVLGHNISPRITASVGDAQEGGLPPKQGPAESFPKDDVFLK